MHVPRIWEKHTAKGTNAHGQEVHATGWGWSESSRDEAISRARSVAGRLLSWLLSKGQRGELGHYGYDERLPREEIVKEYADEHGDPSAYVSRNPYGALILNTRDLMFIDVDIPPSPPANPFSFLKRLMGGTTPETPAPGEIVLGQIRETAMHHDGSSFRVYRTHSGFRVTVTSELLLADSPRAQQLLLEFQADPLYIRMCKNQQCFRARLTPKPWRCQIKMPPARYPFADSAAEAAYRSWEKEYNNGVSQFSTCQLVETIGNNYQHPAFTEMIELHDRLAKVGTSAPLA